MIENDEKKYLFSYFDDSKLWASFDLWEDLYKNLIQEKDGDHIEKQITEIFNFVKKIVKKEKKN